MSSWNHLARLPWKALLAAAGVIVFGHWFAVSTEHVVQGWIGSWIILLSLPLFTIAFVWLYRHRHAFSHAVSLSRMPATPQKGLILVVSRPNPKGPRLAPGSGAPFEVLDGNGRTVTLAGEDLGADIQALDGLQWNWQQLLRALKTHQESLGCAVLVGSVGGNGSHAHLPDAERLIRHYAPQAIVELARPVDFEEFNDVVTCLQASLKRVREHHRIPMKDTVIDVTGGQKTASIAAASITLNSEVRFQYVQSTDHPETHMYDVLYHLPPGTGE